MVGHGEHVVTRSVNVDLLSYSQKESVTTISSMLVPLLRADCATPWKHMARHFGTTGHWLGCRWQPVAGCAVNAGRGMLLHDAGQTGRGSSVRETERQQCRRGWLTSSLSVWHCSLHCHYRNGSSAAVADGCKYGVDNALQLCYCTQPDAPALSNLHAWSIDWVTQSWVKINTKKHTLS